MKHTCITIIALFFSFGVFAQTAKIPKLVEVVKPVIGSLGPEDMVFSFECAAAWGDYNNDGFLDLITSGVGHNWEKTTILYKNNGNGTFTKVEHPFLALQNSTVTWLDYNNDGNLDLFITGIDDIGTYSGLFKNLGKENNFEFEEVFEGVFEPLYNGGGNRSNRYVIAGDYNNDGWVDLYMQGKNEDGVYSLLYRNEGGFTFTKIDCPVNGNRAFIPQYGHTAVFGDYNNDGFLDLLTSGYSNISDYNSRGAYYKNNGDGTFSEPVLVEGSVHGEVAWMDYNNDGNLDFIITGYSFLSGVGWQGDLFENKGDNTFKRITSAATGLSTTQDCSIACGDVNNDGFEDVLFLYSHPNALFLNNSGNKTFKRLSLPYANDKNYDQSGGMVCLVDFDRDNDLDVYTIGYGGNFLPGLLRNDLSDDIPVNTPPTVPSNLKANTKEQGVITFSWDASTDDHTSSKAINYNLYVQKEGSAEIMSVLPADTETGLLKVNETLAPITSTQYKLYGLEDGNYTFGVQAIDNGKLTSMFATTTFSIGGGNLKTQETTPVHIYKEGNTCVISSGEMNWDEVSVFDVRGIQLKKIPGRLSHTTINMLLPGIYIIKIKINNELVIKKVII